MHCEYCDLDTIAGAAMVQEGGAIKILDCCTKCGKAYKTQRTIDTMPGEQSQAKPAAPPQATTAKVVTHPSASSSAMDLAEQARTRLAQVETELQRFAQLKRERTMLRRMVRAAQERKS